MGMDAEGMAPWIEGVAETPLGPLFGKGVGT